MFIGIAQITTETEMTLDTKSLTKAKPIIKTIALKNHSTYDSFAIEKRNRSDGSEMDTRVTRSGKRIKAHDTIPDQVLEESRAKQKQKVKPSSKILKNDIEKARHTEESALPGHLPEVDYKDVL